MKNRKETLGQQAGTALLWNIFFLPLKTVLALAVPLAMVRIFGRGSYVDLAVVSAMQASLGLFVDLGIERALPRFVGQIEREYGRGALRRFLVRIILIKLAILSSLSAVLVIFAHFFIEFFGLGERGQIYLAWVVALLILGALYDICTQILYSFFKQKVTNILDIVVNVLNPLLTLALIGWPFQLEVYGVMLALLITTIICVGVAGWQAWLASQEAVISKETKSLPTARENVWRRFAQYAALMYFFNVSVWFYDAPFAILIFTSYQEALTVVLIRLIYSFVKQLLKTLLIPFVGIQTPLFAAIQVENKAGQLQAAYASLSRLQIFLLIPSAFGMIVVARNLVDLLFIQQGSNAVLRPSDLSLATWATILTVGFTFLEALISLPMVILQVYGYYRLVIFSRLLPLLGGPLLILTAMLHWNIVVAVCIMGVMAVGSRLIALIAAQRSLGLDYPTAFLFKVAGASLLFVIVLLPSVLFLPSNWWVTLSAAVVGAIIFMVAFRRLGGFEAEDKKRLANLKIPFKKYVLRWL